MATQQRTLPPIHRRLVRLLPTVALLLGTSALGAPAAAQDQGSGDAQARNADDLLIVDCLLPHKTRRLGRRNTFLVPRQPIRTTAADCGIRGGEYTAPDQATYATSLEVWLPRAKEGDAEAQFYVGQIFERGLGTTSDYESAALWYRRAADQDYAPAQITLGSFYEEGLGVEADPVQAMSWYRRAAGLTEELVVLEASELEDLRDGLAAQQTQVEELEAQVEELRRQIAAEETENATLSGVLERLEADLARRRAETEADRTRIAELEADLAAASTRVARVAEVAPATASGSEAGSDAGSDAAFDDLALPDGRYLALVIGNSQYRDLPALDRADEDARRVAQVLESRYGFDVRLLVDADRYQILSALNELREDVTSSDRLVVYYAGHGHREQGGRDAWWQPVDAAPDNPLNWIPSAQISEHLDLMAANHVLLLANAVFGGLRTRSSVARLPRGMTEAEHRSYVRRLAERRTRLVLTADADGEPDPDFTDALVHCLEENDGLLEASRLYEEVNERLYTQRGDASNLEFATLRWARNDLSDFFFVPATH